MGEESWSCEVNLIQMEMSDFGYDDVGVDPNTLITIQGGVRDLNERQITAKQRFRCHSRFVQIMLIIIVILMLLQLYLFIVNELSSKNFFEMLYPIKNKVNKEEE